MFWLLWLKWSIVGKKWKQKTWWWLGYKIFSTALWFFFFHNKTPPRSLLEFFPNCRKILQEISIPNTLSTSFPPTLRHFNLQILCLCLCTVCTSETLTQRVRVVYMPWPTKNQFVPFGENNFSVENGLGQIILSKGNLFPCFSFLNICNYKNLI